MTASDHMKELPDRSEVNINDTWDLTAIYPTKADWEAACKTVEARLPKIETYKGQLNTVETIKACNDLLTELYRELAKIQIYAHLTLTQDISNSEAQQMITQAMNLITAYNQKGSFVSSELVEQDEAFLRECAEHPSMTEHRLDLLHLIRRKPHILSDKEEKLLARAITLWQDMGDAYSKLENVDMKFEHAEDSNGNPHRVTHGTYGKLMEAKDRKLRQSAYTSMLSEFKDHVHTCAATLNGKVKQNLFLADVRHYKNTLHAALHPNAIDESVYHSLIENTSDHLDVLHEYVDVRRRKLGYTDIHMWDLHVPLVPNCEIHFTYDEAVEVIIEALKPLGDEYVDILHKGLTEQRWVDKYENKGKRSGAFSSGCHDTYPYIMMNFNGTLDNVYTLAHESGHSMHSYLSRKHQPATMSSYPIFTAEIASTLNECLLNEYFLHHYSGDNRKCILSQEINTIRGTFFRQTKFAEFELLTHQHVENGNALTADWLCEKYGGLNQKYYGNAMTYDELIQYEWARIPHFYSNYYVYQYATGIACAYQFGSRILSGEVEPFLNLLRSGGNDFPLNQLKRAGVDMTHEKTYEPIMNRFAELVREFE
ncbi:MAG: oligoendopeptidase F [Gemmatimonadetes bacterium]|nr:MAG: oligoendopeptidase F [Gemmatimonadota bacterium]